MEALIQAKPIAPPARVPDSITVDKLSEMLMSHVVRSEPELPTVMEPTGLEEILQSYFTGQQSMGPGLRGRPVRKDWSDMKCFSCGKSGHSATRCPKLDVSFPFILPGWKAEKTPTGYMMISPKMGGKRRLTRRKGFAFRVSNKDRPHDPGGGVDWVRGAIPQEDQIMNLKLDTDRACCDNPVPMISLQREGSTGQEEGQTKIMLTEPSRCPVTTMEVEGTITDTRASIPDRYYDCGIQMTTGHNSVMAKDKDMEPRPIRTDTVKAESAQMEGETVLLHPEIFLEVPVSRFPGVFLKLAEEARNSELVYDRPSVVNAVHSQWFGRARRTMITEIIDRFPSSGSEDSRVSRTSPEVSPDLNHVEPIIRLGPVGRLENTAEPIMLGAKTNQGKISPPGPVGQYVRNTAEPIMLGAKTNQGKISPPGPVGQYVRMTRRLERMDRPDPVGPDEELLVDSGPAGLVRTRCPVGTVMLPALRDAVRPVAGSPVDTSPVPCFRICSKNSSGDDSYQPFVTGPSGVNVSDDGHDTGQPRVSDPLNRPTSLDPKGTREILSLSEGYQSATICSKNLSPDNSYQPLVTGPLGANVRDVGHDTGQTRVSDAVRPEGPQGSIVLG